MRHGKYRFLAGALIVPLTLYGVFVLSPYLQAFQLAFTDWNGVDAQPEPIGIGNFTRLWSDPLFLAALRHNGLILLVVPLAVIVLALALAAATKGTRVYRTVYFFPQLLSVAIIAVLWQFVYTPNSGLLNGALSALGLDSWRRSWLARRSRNRASPASTSRPR